MCETSSPQSLIYFGLLPLESRLSLGTLNRVPFVFYSIKTHCPPLGMRDACSKAVVARILTTHLVSSDQCVRMCGCELARMWERELSKCQSQRYHHHHRHYGWLRVTMGAYSSQLHISGILIRYMWTCYRINSRNAGLKHDIARKGGRRNSNSLSKPRTKTRPNHNKAAVACLKQWLDANLQHPYISPLERDILASKSGLTETQVTTWFHTAQKRMFTHSSTGRTTDTSDSEEQEELVLKLWC